MTNSPTLNVIIGILLAVSFLVSAQYELKQTSEVGHIVNTLIDKSKKNGSSVTFSAKDISINQCVGVAMALSKKGFALSAGEKLLKTQGEQVSACHQYTLISAKHIN